LSQILRKYRNFYVIFADLSLNGKNTAQLQQFLRFGHFPPEKTAFLQALFIRRTKPNVPRAKRSPCLPCLPGSTVAAVPHPHGGVLFLFRENFSLP
jgi:hypothetical protein